MTDNANLVDIRTVMRKENSSRVDNAMFFLEQVKNHTLFRVDQDVVEVRFSGKGRTLSASLASYIQEKNRA